MGFHSDDNKRHDMHRVWLLLGANLGDAGATFGKALGKMAEAGVKLIKTSALYQSEAWGEGVQGIFYNQAAEVLTDKEPLAVLELLNAIELSLGRRRRPGLIEPRPVDIDILFYDEAVVNLPGLVIPHPRLHLRRFVLMPLCEIAPELQHPLFGKTVHQLLLETGDHLLVEKIAGP